MKAGLLRCLCLLMTMASSASWSQQGNLSPESAAGRGVVPPSQVNPLVRYDIRAQLLPRRFTTLAAEIGAKISVITIKEGEAFKTGQVLLEFDCSLQQAQLDKALADLEGAEHTLKSNLRLQELNSVGQLELDLSRTATQKARAEVNAHKAVMSKCQTVAPFSGRLAEQKVREQQYVQPGQPMLDILDDSALELEFLVPSSWLRWLKVGGSFEVQIDETRKIYPARFTRVGARVDPVSQSIKISASITGRYPELMAGMSGKVMVKVPD